MISHMKQLKEQYGITNFSLVHDMYTIDRKKVVEFCEALLACQEDFIWSCSARTDRIDDELIALMARAGCRGIFFGIETGSARLQKVINKNLNLPEATKRISSASEHGISTAVALITGFPDETRDDLRETIHYYIDSLRFQKAEPQLSLLAPLAKTPIQIQYGDQLVFDHIFSDMSHQGWRQDAAEIEMIQAHPAVFPNFYAVPTLQLERAYFKDIRDFIVGITEWFRWLQIALVHDHGDFLEIFDRWKVWRDTNLADEAKMGPDTTPYYHRRQFPEEFLEFVRTYYISEMARVPSVISAVIESELFSQKWEQGISRPKSWRHLRSLIFSFFLIDCQIYMCSNLTWITRSFCNVSGINGTLRVLRCVALWSLFNGFMTAKQWFGS